jgi:orotidine-5'-phosphate decarboxylase
MPAAARTTAPMSADPRLICPLDMPTRGDAEAMVERLGDAVSFYKVGLELLATEGMALAKDLRRRGRQVFADWKLHDIGATVERAAAAIAASGAADFLTVHAEPQVMAAAVKGRGGARYMKILGVTVLTSLSEADLKDLGYGFAVASLVERRIRQAIDAGPNFLVVTPGVRPAWSAKNDQARAATPADALKAGASHLVCGRPITAANDPRAAALQVVEEMAGL